MLKKPNKQKIKIQMRMISGTEQTILFRLPQRTANLEDKLLQIGL
jgi:hypothetical protein